MRLFALLVQQFTVLAAQATCMFARDAKPQDWYEWASVLVAGDVAAVGQRGSIDVVSLRVVETFKGPPAAATATLEVPQNLWATCRIERPAVGERVLGALNANNDALLVPLTSAYADRPIGELSGGEQQRLLIAQALVTRPRILALDEPLDSLDLRNQQGVANVIRQISRETDAAVLLVAHDVNPILTALDRVVYVAHGQVAEGTPEEVINTETLSRLYGTPIEVLRGP